jgi:class 3 adenylate cyclase/TolB-like protein
MLAEAMVADGVCTSPIRVTNTMATARVERRLAAILVADVVGYSRLMEQDEAGTLARLQAHRQELIEPLLREHRGRTVKLMGDGALCEFASVFEAVSCAEALQLGMADRERNTPEEQRIRFRIGINLGDVIVEDGDIYGDGVNVAARLERLAEPGGVCISGSAHQQIKGKLPSRLMPMGAQRMKNIAEPIEAWRMLLDAPRAQSPQPAARERRWTLIVAAGLASMVLASGIAATLWWRPTEEAGDKVATGDILAIPTGPAVGVLPFTNLSGDPGQDFLAAGLTDEITASLTRFRQLRVISRGTMVQTHGRATNLDQLGRELGLSYVLEGSVRRSTETLRITAQLIDVHDGGQVWAESYNRPLTAAAVIEVQEEVAAKIVSAIGSSSGGAIASSQMRAARGKSPERLASYECVVTAIAWYDRDPSLYPTVRTCLRETVQLDPDYADAWALLADVYAKQWYGYESLYPGEHYDPLERSLEAARQAVLVAPDNARAHFAMAKAFFMAGDLDGFYAEAQQALRLNPNEPVYLGSLGNWIAYTGRWEEGLALVDKAAKLSSDAFAPWWHFAGALNHFRHEEYKQALTLFQRSFTGWWVNYMHQAYTYGMLGDRARAEDAVARLRELVPGFSIASAVEFHRKYQFEPSYIDKVIEGLSRAGLPST